ncbi:hypothetical protein ISN44_As02g001420 [Arabidopsis suecica]|uniref:Transmembrane protein n=1 Tax=Arabidopsis suecica TaxID=45249 RepID=A0A8T2GAI1_ARASU|nr:hypothetical protein ISN44_As02g001420 [Arabidopsis suecica]
MLNGGGGVECRHEEFDSGDERRSEHEEEGGYHSVCSTSGEDGGEKFCSSSKPKPKKFVSANPHSLFGGGVDLFSLVIFAVIFVVIVHVFLRIEGRGDGGNSENYMLTEDQSTKTTDKKTDTEALMAEDQSTKTTDHKP